VLKNISRKFLVMDFFLQVLLDYINGRIGDGLFLTNTAGLQITVMEGSRQRKILKR